MKIQNIKHQIFIVLFFIFLPVSVFSQNQVQVKLRQPPPNQLRAADIWKLNIINITRSTLEVTLHGTLKEAGAGIVVEGTSKPITLAPGSKTITYDDVKSGSVNFNSSKWRETFTRTGNAPSGEYEICVTVNDKSGEIIGSDCIEQKVEIALPPTLISPADGETIQAEQPVIFTWMPPMPTPSGQVTYKLKIVEILGNQSPEAAMQQSRSFFEKGGIKTTTFQYPKNEKKLEAGNKYAWSISIEMDKDIVSSSSYSTFYISNCNVNLSLSLDSVICKSSKDGENIFRICVKSSYSSNVFDLTYNNTGSVFKAYHPSGSPVYAVSNLSPSLQPQYSGPSTNVNYCFDVSVPSNQDAIVIGLQGDDKDPGPITCQPGASIPINLPSCRCNECDTINLNFKGFSGTHPGDIGDQFNISGNIIINIPVYGVEIQMQSYSYEAQPSGCTNGVATLEQSGMILKQGTTINGLPVQMFTEATSGNVNTNDNASKIVKLTSITPLSGEIPVKLNMGLPGPINGLDQNCCKMIYEVCIKVRVFYDPESCKSCTYTHCVKFNNQ